MGKVQIPSTEVVFCTDHTNKASLWSLCSSYKDWWQIHINKPDFVIWCKILWQMSDSQSLNAKLSPSSETSCTPLASHHFWRRRGWSRHLEMQEVMPVSCCLTTGCVLQALICSSGWFCLKLASTATANFSLFIPFTLSRKLLKWFYSAGCDLDL